MATIHVAVKSLPMALQRALDSVAYGRKDIALNGRETVRISDSGGAGKRCFAIIVNMGTGELKTLWGSWGGPNMFNRDNAVDLDGRSHAIPPNGAVIRGHIGGTVDAEVYVRPDALAPMLPAIPTATDEELAALYCYSAIKSGPYRQDELRRRNVTQATVDACVSKGWLKRASNGATSITTEGRNVRESGKAVR
jgi:hypothetical protein